MKLLKRSIASAALLTALAAPVAAFAHGPGGGPGFQGQGQMMGHVMTGCPMYGSGWAMGPSTMGQGQMMGPGMMQQPGRMGPGMQGGMMGGGQMMGPGMRGPSGMAALPEDLTVDNVRHMLEHQIAAQGNPRLKLGTVEETDADTITAEIVTQDGSLVQRLEVDRHTGWTQPAS